LTLSTPIRQCEEPTDRTDMAEYILALDGTKRIHVGKAGAFKQHIGTAAGGNFDPARVIALAAEFELYDEVGRRLEAREVGGDVEIVPVAPERRTAGEKLVARITFIVARAQASLDQARRRSCAAAAAAVGATTSALDHGGNPAAASIRPLIDQLPDAIEEVDSLIAIRNFPVVQAELRVVLAALAEDFGSTDHNGPPHDGDDHHDWLHRRGMTHP
jgi:hypothetical protein